jgi:excisionase family DNA binding protein
MQRNYTINEAAAVAGLGYMTIYQAIRFGILPAERFGRQYSINPLDLARYIDARAARKGVMPNVR